jgi:hypothetical protein
MTELDLPSVVAVLIKHLPHTSVQTKVAVLHWIYLLHIRVPNKVHVHKKLPMTIYSKSSFILHTWGMWCVDRLILPLKRTVTYDTQF